MTKRNNLRGLLGCKHSCNCCSVYHISFFDRTLLNRSNCFWFELYGTFRECAPRDYRVIGYIYLLCFPVLNMRALHDPPPLTKEILSKSTSSTATGGWSAFCRGAGGLCAIA